MNIGFDDLPITESQFCFGVACFTVLVSVVFLINGVRAIVTKKMGLHYRQKIINTMMGRKNEPTTSTGAVVLGILNIIISLIMGGLAVAFFWAVNTGRV